MTLTNRRRVGARGLRGLTIIEVLAVMTVLAILVAVLVPSVQSAKTKGAQLRCLSNARQIGIAMNMHMIEKRHYPLCNGSYNFQVQLAPYLGQSIPNNMTSRLDQKTLCNETMTKYAGMFGYGFNETLTLDLSPGSPPYYNTSTIGGLEVVLDGENIPYPSRKIAMVCNKGGNYWAYGGGSWDITTFVNWFAVLPEGIHGGKDNYLFCDGHVESMAPAESARINEGWFLKTKGSPYQN